MSGTSRGFMALIVVVVIGLVFLLAVVSLGRLGITGRFALLTIEEKLQSEAYAEACIHVARVSAMNDPQYAATNIAVAYKDLSCTVVSVEAATPSAGYSRIRAQSAVAGATTNFEVVMRPADGSIVSWREVPNW